MQDWDTVKENEPRKKDICTVYRFVHDKYFTGKLYWSWPPVQLSGSIRWQFECSVLLLPAFWLHICKLGAQLPDLNERLRSHPLRQEPSERVKTPRSLLGQAALWESIALQLFFLLTPVPILKKGSHRWHTTTSNPPTFWTGKRPRSQKCHLSSHCAAPALSLKGINKYDDAFSGTTMNLRLSDPVSVLNEDV